ncbi:MAG: thiamine-phosphate kinase [Candidatus Bathyarchaeia archaeon]
MLQTLRELGEHQIIEILQHIFGSSSRTTVGFGDDVSAIKLSKDRVAVLKTDMLVGSTDMPPGMTLRQAAWKAAIANVSDLAAKGVRPYAGLVALGLPAKLTKSDIKQIANGLRDVGKSYRFPFVGGDTNESEDLTISIALFGLAQQKRLVLRKGARDGDIVAVTGEFGATSAGLKALLEYDMKPSELPQSVYEAVFHPRAQLDLGLKLAASGALTSSIDSSDGLAWSLHELAVASRAGILIHEVPVSKDAIKFAKSHSLNSADLALYGGEEYHLVLTVRPNRFNSAVRASKGRLKAIGIVTNRFRGVRALHEGREIQVEPRGWEHFKAPRSD